MPGRIESVPFLSQIEDVDKYLLEYRSLKLTSQSHSGNYCNSPGVVQQRQVQGQVRYNQNTTVKVNNEFREGNMAGKSGTSVKTLPAGNYNDSDAIAGSYIKGNSHGANFNDTMMANRKMYVGNGNQGHRYNNHSSVKYGVQYPTHNQLQVKQPQSAGFGQTSMIANHFKQVYPQVGYNSSGTGGSNLALDQLSSPFMIGKAAQTSQGYASSGSSPSPAPPRVDSALNGNSSISSYNEHVMPSSSINSNSQFSGHRGQFQNYLDSGLVSSSSVVSGISSNTNIYNSTNGDAVGGYSASSLAAERNSSTGTPMNFEPSISASIMVSEPISSDRVPVEAGLNGFEAPSASMTGSTNNLLMNDYSVGWGSNHANTSSNASGAFGIWNNDMSVWS